MSERNSPPVPCGNCTTSLAWDEQVRPRGNDRDQRILCMDCRHLRGARSRSSSAAVAPNVPTAHSDRLDVDKLAAALRANVRAAGGTPSPVPLTREDVADELARLMDGRSRWQAPAALDAVAQELEALMGPPRAGGTPQSTLGTSEADEVARELEKLMGPPKAETNKSA